MSFIRRFTPFLLLLAAACDPCTGVGACGEPRIRYEGSVMKSIGHRPGGAAGVRVKFSRAEGVALESDTVVAWTDEDGRFLLEARTRGEGEVAGDLWIYPPSPISPTRVEGVRLLTSRAPGEVRRLGRLDVPYPYLGYQVALYSRATRAPAPGVEVEFRRTGGIAIEPDTFRVAANKDGRAMLWPRVRESGQVTGDITVYPLPPLQPFTVRGVTLRTFVQARPDSTISIGIGSWLPWAAHVYWEKDRTPAEGVEVEFRRTSGVRISPDPFVSGKSDRFGTVWVNPVPLAPGEVVGDVTIRPPPPGETVVIRDVRLPTVEDERHPGMIFYWGIPVSDSTAVGS